MRGYRGIRLIPLFIDLEGKRAVVFGAGPVGTRKALFLAQEAHVTMVDRSPKEAPASISVVVGEALENLHLIDRSDIVVAATGEHDVDEEICLYAREHGKLFNRADVLGNFLIPSVVQRRNFTVAVSTEGRSPGMSRHIRLMLEDRLAPELEGMVDLTERVRGEIKEVLTDPLERERVVREVLEDPLIWDSLIAQDGRSYEMAMEKVRDRCNLS